MGQFDHFQKLYVFEHDCNPLCMDCTQVWIFKHFSQLNLRFFLNAHDNMTLKQKFNCNFTLWILMISITKKMSTIIIANCQHNLNYSAKNNNIIELGFFWAINLDTTFINGNFWIFLFMCTKRFIYIGESTVKYTNWSSLPTSKVDLESFAF